MKFLISIILLFVLLSHKIIAETSRQPEGVFIEQKLGHFALLDLIFLDEDGNRVTMKQFFQDKPIIIAPSYYECPRLCTLVYNGLRKVIEDTEGLVPGRDYKIISISFNPDDDYKKASQKGEAYRNSFKSFKLKKSDWIFLVIENTEANANNAKFFLESLGYYYKKDKNEYSHPAAIIFLTKEGKISKYLYGIQFLARDFRFAIIEASEGKIGTPVDTLLMSCFRYDSIQGRYAPYAWGFIRIGGIFILIFVLGIIGILFFLERRKKAVKFDLK
ncbi:MAG: hypothetical protein ACK4UJ_07530 [Leptonema sp. (in: bacteria)]